jgi:hypothetical protein
MANRLNGSGALNYTGVNAPTPPNLVTMTRRPTVTDGVGMPLGTYWLIPQAAAGITPQKEVWILVGNRQNVFTWKHLRGSTQPEPLAAKVTVYDTPGSYTYTPTEGMINVTVECVGGGGGSSSYRMQTGAVFSGSLTGQAAGGGAYCKKTFSASTIGASQSFVVGQGGQSPAVSCTVDTTTTYFCVETPQDGQDTTFGSFLTAGGGKAQTAGYPYAGIGGVASGGDINLNGEDAVIFGEYVTDPYLISSEDPSNVPLNVYTNIAPTYPFNGGALNSHIGGNRGGNSAMSLGLGARKISNTLVPFSTPIDGGYYAGEDGGSYGGGANAPYATIGVNSAAAYDIPGAAGGDGVVIITEYL